MEGRIESYGGVLEQLLAGFEGPLRGRGPGRWLRIQCLRGIDCRRGGCWCLYRSFPWC